MTFNLLSGDNAVEAGLSFTKVGHLLAIEEENYEKCIISSFLFSSFRHNLVVNGAKTYIENEDEAAVVRPVVVLCFLMW